MDKNILNVPFDAFEKILFFHLLDHGFSSAYIQRYLRLSNFVSQRVPLVVLLSGPPTELRRTLAQALASRLNMQNVQQSDLMYDAIMAIPAQGDQQQANSCTPAGNSYPWLYVMCMPHMLCTTCRCQFVWQAVEMLP